jgi:hypothetical protein
MPQSLCTYDYFVAKLLYVTYGIDKCRVKTWRSGFLFSEPTFVIVENEPVLISVTASEPAAGLAELVEISSKSGKFSVVTAKAHCASSSMITPSHKSCRCACENSQEYPGRKRWAEFVKEVSE